MRTFNSMTKYENGVYISLNMKSESILKLEEYMNDNLGGCELTHELHCTLIYSKKEYVGDIETNVYEVSCEPKRFSFFGPEKDVLVIELNSKFLEKRNNELKKKYGFVSDFEIYKPHCSLSYNCKDIDLDMLPPIDFDIIFHEETVEPLDEEFLNSLKLL